MFIDKRNQHSTLALIGQFRRCSRCEFAPAPTTMEIPMTNQRLGVLLQALTTLVVSAALGAGMMVFFDYAARTIPV